MVYPGSGNDGDAVRLFGKAKAAHCFLHIDHGMEEATIRTLLADPEEGFRGYRPMLFRAVAERELAPHGWQPHAAAHEVPDAAPHRVKPYALFVVLERLHGFGEDHGGLRLAILFLAGDAHFSFDALFCQGDATRAPYAMLLQEHQAWGNNTQFGGGRLLNRIARRTSVFPDWLLVSHGTLPWPEYHLVEQVSGHVGGQYRVARCLYKRD